MSLFNPTSQNVVDAARCVCHKPLAESLDGALKDNFPEKAKDDLKIIDVGAGTGLIGIELQKLGYSNLQALDISPEMLKEAKKRNIYKRFFCVALSDQQIPEIQTGEFDALICAGSLLAGHIRAAAFEEMVRMVKHGKIVVIVFFSSCTVCHKKECQSILNYLTGDNDNNNNNNNNNNEDDDDDDDNDDDNNDDYEDIDDTG